VKSSKAAYRADIDGLRAIAVLLVVVFHFKLVPGVSSGFMGVDVFFVISGFLITRIIREGLHSGAFRLRTFWIHRIRRLAPALIATTLLTLLAGWLWLLPPDFSKLAEQTIAAQLYYANIFYWRNVNYFGLQAHDVYLLHTWSLAVEEQFYLLYPLTLLAIARWAKGRTALVLMLLAAISFGINLAFVGSKPQATFYLMPSRAWELLAGALLSVYVARVPHPRPKWATSAGLGGLVLLVTAVATYREGTVFPGWFALLPTIAGVLLIGAGSNGDNPVTRALSSRPLPYIGRISYPLYLVHWPINVFAVSALAADYSWAWRLAMLALSFALAASIYHLIELSVRSRLVQRRLSTTVHLYGGTLAAAVAFSGAILVTGGMPMRFSERVSHLASYLLDTPPELERCEYKRGVPIGPKTTCRLGNKAAAPRWFVYGDSHAWAASGAVDRWLESIGQSGLLLYEAGCPPVRGVYLAVPRGADCFAFNEASLSFLGQQSELSHVLLISTWRQAPEGILSTAFDHRLAPSESVSLFQRQFAATLNALHEQGKEVYVWEPLPGARANVPRAMAEAESRAARPSIDFTDAEYRAEFGFFFDALRSNADLIAGTFSPERELCGSGRCATQIEGAPLYFDNSHMAYSSSTFWGRAMARQLAIIAPRSVTREK
jgi:peptidoglycan/LPS O-acetylase OafA/YrhL